MEDRAFSCGWNFGPINNEMLTVEEIVKRTTHMWKKNIEIHYDLNAHLHESAILQLDSSNAAQKLGWRPKLSIHSTIEWTIQWYKSYEAGSNMYAYTLNQIKQFQRIKGV